MYGIYSNIRRYDTKTCQIGPTSMPHNKFIWPAINLIHIPGDTSVIPLSNKVLRAIITQLIRLLEAVISSLPKCKKLPPKWQMPPTVQDSLIGRKAYLCRYSSAESSKKLVYLNNIIIWMFKNYKLQKILKCNQEIHQNVWKLRWAIIEDIQEYSQI